MYKYYLKSFLCIIALTSLFFKNANADLLVGSPEGRLVPSTTNEVVTTTITLPPPHRETTTTLRHTTTTTVRPTTTTIRPTTTTVRHTTTTTTVREEVCLPPKNYISGVCCPANKPYLVNRECSVCPANENLVGGKKCCPEDKRFLVRNQCSPCPSNQKLINNKCCPLTSNYVVGGRCSVCPAGKRVAEGVPGGCCPNSQRYVYDRKCSNCASFKFSATRVGWEGLGSWNQSSGLPSCVKRFINAVRAYCDARVGRGSILEDDCWTAFATSSSEGKVAQTNKITYMTVDSRGRCHERSTPPPGKVCDAVTVYWYQTPISLLLNTEYEDFQKESRVVNFSLGPNARDYSVWKGSDKAPLLVFDPEHKGQITSAEQLFGNWAFGGKKQASLASTNKTSSAWANGYEALGSMDTNNDGVVSGDELSSLALWFDENRNAKSEAGEVKPLIEVGIKTLYYKEYSKDGITQDLIASVGFEREVSGKIEKGVSVDWYGVTGNSEIEVTQKLLSNKSLCQEADISSSVAFDNTKAIQETATAKNSNGLESDFVGPWIWSSKNNEEGSGGLLLFARDKKEGIIGVSVVQVSLETGRDFKAEEEQNILEEMVTGVKEEVEEEEVLLSQIPLKGRIVKAEESSAPVLEFSYSGKDGTLIENKAYLSEDKQTLSGSTKAYIVNGTEKLTKAEYNWTAIRDRE